MIGLKSDCPPPTPHTPTLTQKYYEKIWHV